MRPIIELDNISKRYMITPGVASHTTLAETITSFAKFRGKKEFWALKDVTFSMEEGETMGIIGENGAGKTTLLKILSRITYPTKGRGVINGRVASLLEVGTGFHHELTGRENIYLNGVILGLKRADINAKFNQIVEFAGVGEFLNTPLKHYSTGMWARLAFSVAAHLEPQILLVDEVLSVGDAQFQKRSLSKMNELSHQGKTVIFVSHNLAAVRQLCSRCTLMSRGEIKQIGDVGEVIESYLTRFNTNSPGFTDLSDNISRKGSKKIALQRVELRDNYGEITGIFKLKDDLNIHLYLKSQEPVKGARVIVQILESGGDSVCNMYDSDSGFSIGSVDGEKHISLNINDIRFCPGKYYISVTILSEILNHKYDYYDEAEFAISFEVHNHLIMDRSLQRSSGLLILTPQWNISDK